MHLANHKALLWVHPNSNTNQADVHLCLCLDMFLPTVSVVVSKVDLVDLYLYINP